MNQDNLVSLKERGTYYANLLTDFLSMVDLALGLDNNTRDLKEEMPKLVIERDGLIETKTRLEKEVVELERERVETRRVMTERAAMDQAVLTKKTNAMQVKLAELEKMHTTRMSQVEAEYKARIESAEKVAQDKEMRAAKAEVLLAKNKEAMARL